MSQNLGAYYEWQERRENPSAAAFIETRRYRELKLAEQIARETLLQTAESRLWVTKWELSQLIRPEYPYRFDRFLDEISISVGDCDFRSPFEHNRPC
jgi:hypothetical protein